MAHNFPQHVGQTRKGQRYDSRHARARRLAARKHHETDPCARCQLPLGPMGPNLHYDHDDSGTGYLGFSHDLCNVRAGSAEGNRRLMGAEQGSPHSRDW